MLHASFAQESLQKNRCGEAGQNLGGDAAGQENAAGGFQLQRQIAGFGSEDGNKNVESLGAHGALAFHRGLGNGRSGVDLEHLLGQPLWYFTFTSVAQEFEYIDQAGAGQNPLVAYVSVTRVQVAEQFDLPVVERSKIAVAAFGGEDMMARAVPEEAALAESGAGRDNALIARGLGGNAIKRRPDPPATSAAIPQPVASRSLIKVVLLRLSSSAKRRDSMVQGRLEVSTRPLVTGPATPKQACVGLNSRCAHKLGDDLIQTGIPPAGENGCRHQIQLAILCIAALRIAALYIKEGQPCVGASDVARQNHLSVFLQCRPSRSSSSSDSLGPQLPAG